MAINDFTIIKRSLVGRMFSTVTTIITVAVAVGLMLVLVSMQESSQRALSRGSGNAHLYLSQESNRLTSVLNGLFYFNPPQSPVSWEKYEQVAGISQGGGGMPPLSYAIPIQQGDTFRGAPVTATTNDFFTKFSTNPNFVPGMPADKQSFPAWEISEGTFLENTFEIVAGAEAAKSANLNLGDEIHLTHGASDEEGLVGGAHEHHEFAWKVVGILKPTGSAHDHAIFTDLTASWIVHAHDRREREIEGEFETTENDLLDEDKKITGIIVRAMTRPGRKVSASTGPLFYKFSRDMDFTVAVPSDEIGKLFDIVSNIDDILFGMAAVVMISSGIAIMLALYNSMEQRRRQIAVLRVLGCSRMRIFGLIMTESAIIGVVGAIVGIVLSVVASYLVAVLLKERIGIVVEPAFPVWIVSVIVLGTVAIACIAGIIPASMAYRTPVSRNLRPIG